MMRRISEKIVLELDRRGVLKHTSKEVYIYGFDIAIYTYLSTLALFLIGWIGGYPFETILLISLYYTNQSLGGGYHASTHARCFLTMVLGMLVFLAVIPITFSLLFQAIVVSLSCLILWHFPLVLHPNKKHLIKKANQYIMRSRRFVVIQLALFCIAAFLHFHRYILTTFTISLAFSAVSRGIAALQYSNLSCTIPNSFRHNTHH